MTNATATKGDLQSSPISECVTTRNTSPARGNTSPLEVLIIFDTTLKYTKLLAVHERLTRTAASRKLLSGCRLWQLTVDSKR